MPTRSALLIPLMLATTPGPCPGDSTNQPNVLFFALDDLCDWVGPLGHEQAITPNLDRLARRGVTFTNAHAPGVFCAPSRTAIFTGRYAHSTGCYRTQVYFHEHPEIVPLQAAFQRAGYQTYGGGKLFHHPAGYVDLRGWDEFFVRSGRQKRSGWPLESWTPAMDAVPDPYPNSAFNADRKPANQFFLEWGPVLDANEGAMTDTIRTEWACNHLRASHDDPFFLAVGLYAPHFPNYCPAKYFDLYDRDQIEPPPYLEEDLEDLPPAVRRAKLNRGRGIHERLAKLGAVEDAIHGYLACVSYADAMLGRLLDALDNGPNARETVVVLWSDHGYHHGEKRDWGKHTLWQRTSRVPLIIAGPDFAQGEATDATVGLIDLYPTLADVCGLGPDPAHDGVSLAEALERPQELADRDVLLPGMEPDSYAVMNRGWRYIHYADGGEELYDVRRDPNEWRNLASLPAYADQKAVLKAKATKDPAPPGLQRNELRLSIEGESFRWLPKD